MTRSVSISVNDMPVSLDYFVHSYIEHVVEGIIGSLHDTGEIENLELTVDNNGHVTLRLNGDFIPLKDFPMEIIRNTLEGMVSTLKGVDKNIDKLEIVITG